jgi:hypothetical protein
LQPKEDVSLMEGRQAGGDGRPSSPDAAANIPGLGHPPGVTPVKHAGTAFLVVMLFATLGLWGFAQQKNGNYASRLRDLENRYLKMDEDYRILAGVGDRHQRRISQLEKERTDLNDQVENLQKLVAECDTLRTQVGDLGRQRDSLKVQLSSTARERDNLRNDLTARTQERDSLADQLHGYTRELQSLIGRIETALSTTPHNKVDAVPASRRSE